MKRIITMSETVLNNEKKKLSKGKKIAVIIVSVLAAIIILALIAGVSYLNYYCETKDYEIASTDKQITLVAHRGLRSVAPENTAPAFEEAGKRGYWGTECDVYMTKDGVWVVSHDKHTYRMMDESAFVEKKTYNELMQMNVDNGTDIKSYPNLKFCTLEEYLQICVKYNMVAVIELKGKNNTEHYDKIVSLVEKYNANAVYISFHFENLEKMRELSDNQAYYLVKKIKQEDIELVKSIENCGIDFDANNEKNFESDIIKKCQQENVPLGAWTVNTTELTDKLYENGVTLITTDCITAD